jgi:ribose 5-phosphate isomerase B
MNLSIAIGSDHAGFEYKEALITWLKEYNYAVKDFGTHSIDSVDYPDFAHPVASAVENNEFNFGILICGSANGVAITANKHQGVRAAICWQEDLAVLARGHNNANVLCIPARYVSLALATNIVDKFLHSPFEGGRHEKRVEKISC